MFGRWLGFLGIEPSKEKLSEDDLKPKIVIDAKLIKDEINLWLVDKLQKLEPFGMGNSRPIFMLEKVKPEQVQTVGQKNDHLKMKIDGIDAIGFGIGYLQKKT